MDRRDVNRWVTTELINVMARHDVPLIHYRLRSGKGELCIAATNLPSTGLEQDITAVLASAADLDIRASVYGTSVLEFRDCQTGTTFELTRGERVFSLDKEMKTLWVHNPGELMVRNSVTGELRLPIDVPEGDTIETFGQYKN